MTMSEERKARCGSAVVRVFDSMLVAVNVLLEEAEERSLVYDVHGSQLADPPGSVTDVWKVRVGCGDGYARNFDEMKQTLDEVGTMIASEDREWVESTRLDGKGDRDWA